MINYKPSKIVNIAFRQDAKFSDKTPHLIFSLKSFFSMCNICADYWYKTLLINMVFYKTKKL